MDDLDHSMRIAGDEWRRFYEECEECALPQPLPASPDNWGLLDLEDSDFTAGHEGQEPPATGDKVNRNALRRRGGNRSLSGGENDDLSSKADSEGERWVLCPNCSEVNTRAAEHITRIASSLRTESDQTADDGRKADREWQSDTFSTCDPLPCKQGAEDLSGKEPRGTAAAAGGVPLRTEKERWFVTVNDSPARQRVRVTSKKKRRLKQPRKNKRLAQSSGWEKLQKNHVEFEANNEKARGNNSDKSSSKEIQKANALANPGLLQLPLTSGQHDGAKYDPSCRAPSLHDACANTGLPGSERAEGDVLADTAERCESDSHPPATPSLGEPQQLLMEPEEITATPPSAAKNVSKTPDEDSCENDTRCTQGSVATLTFAPQTHEMSSSPSVCGSSGDQLSPASIPDFTPCSAADNPETRAAASGHTRPVYAISAFWDDMEKVTINDILQLRMARGASPRVADKSPHVSLGTNHCSLTHSKSPGGVPPDTSDTADSDYFTQLDESKPDHWGGDLSTSDFEEEQLLGASRNCSPDPQGSKQSRASCSPYLADEEGESTASEGMETPVPAGEFTQTCLEDQECIDLHSNTFVQAQRLVKSKSMHDVRALSDEDLSLRGEDESRPVLCSPPDKNSSEIPFLSNEVTSDNHAQMFYPEVFEDVIGEDKAKRVSGAVLLYDPDPVLDYSLLTFREDILFTLLHYSQETIPIFSYSRPIIRTFTFPSSVFLNPVCKIKHFKPPLEVVPGSPGDGGTTAVVPRGFHNNKDFTVTKYCLHHKAGIWCRCSGAWMLPLDMVALRRADPPVNAVTERGAASTSSQSESAEQQIWEKISLTSKSKMS